MGAVVAALVAPAVASAAPGPPYTLKFDSTQVNNLQGKNNEALGTETSEYVATVSLTTMSSGMFTGSSQGSYAQASGSVMTPCMANNTSGFNTETEESGTGTTFGASITPAASGAGGTITVTVGSPPLNVPEETYQDVPGCGGITVGNTTQRWWSDWTDEHKSDLVPLSAFTYKLTLTPGSGDTIGAYTSDETITQPDPRCSDCNLTIDETTTITVTETPCDVPDVVDQPLAAAESALVDAGCTVGAVTKQKSTVHKGNVISSSPSAGSSEAPLTAVALVVSKGKKAKKVSCKVPNVKGKKLAAAKKAIKKAHCAVGKVTKKRSSKKKKGKVLSESPPARAVKPKGTKVKLTVGK